MLWMIYPPCRNRIFRAEQAGDDVWNAKGPDTPAGASVPMVAADGTLLTVEPAP